MNVNMISHTPIPEKLIERAGRICYKSEEKISENSHIGFIGGIVRNRHHSVLEHASATFEISGISRSLTHQLVRHRLASFSQRSQRYVSENNFEFVTPPSISNDDHAHSIFIQLIENITLVYSILNQLDIPKEDSRFILPNATCAEIVMTANFREWIHIIDERVTKHAQWEIRDMCVLIWKKLYEISPTVFSIETFKSNNMKNIDYKCDIFENEIVR